MTTGLQLFVKGVILGLGAAMPIGPVNVEIARRGLRRGFVAAFALGCGAVTVDIFYAIATSLGLRSLLDHPNFYWPMRLGGLVLLGYMGIMSLRGAVAEVRQDRLSDATRDPPRTTARAGYLTGLLMTLLNPMTVGFWLVAVPGVLGPITDTPGRDLPIICSGVFVATLGWVVCFSGLMGWLGKYRRRWWLAIADAVGGAVLIGFAAVLLLRSIRSLL